MRSLMVLVPILAVLAACAGSSPAGRAGSDGRIRVVTTTTQLTDFTRQVGGSHVRVYSVLRPNVDPHDYEPSPADLQQLAGAAVLVENGVGLEKWFAQSIKSADPHGEVVDASVGVHVRKGQQSDEKTTGDPHIWQNPRNAVTMVHDIERGLQKADPVHRADYRRNAQRYTGQLRALDAEVSADLAKLTNRKVVTNHDAFGYYLDRYGLDFVGSVIPSFDTQAELSARDVERIVTRIKRLRVKAIFSETSVPPKTAETIGREAGVKVVAGPAALYGDTLGPPGSAGDTYVKAIRHNTEALVDNLS